MVQKTAEQQLILSLLRDVLSQRGAQTPYVQLERYQFALRRYLYSCPRQDGVYQTAPVYAVLVEAMHAIYRCKETASEPWLEQVEDATYDAFLRLDRL